MPASDHNAPNGRRKRGVAPMAIRVDDQATRAERRRQALELRRAGVTYERISETLGYGNRSNAYRDVHTALADITKQPAEEYLAEQLDRCEALITALWPQRREPGTAMAILRVMEREARYKGADAPTRQVITVIPEDAFDTEIRRLEQLMADREAAALEPADDAQP